MRLYPTRNKNSPRGVGKVNVVWKNYILIVRIILHSNIIFHILKYDLNKAIIASGVALWEVSKDLLKHLFGFGGIVGLWEFVSVCILYLSSGSRFKTLTIV
jgi:hypothetical protein